MSCPRPGTEAVFEHKPPRKGFVNTSTVTRVVLRLRVLTVPHERVEPTWENVTGSHKLPEHRRAPLSTAEGRSGVLP